MSDQENFKKDQEEEALGYFATEYFAVTGKRIHSCVGHERPDFICQIDDDGPVGVEIVRVMVDPESRFWRRTLDRDDYMDPLDTAIRLQEAVYLKEKKRQSGSWKLPDDTILVLAVLDAPLEELTIHLDPELYDEMSDTGFREIWAADFTILEAFYTVQLLGIKPAIYRGLHEHHSRTWKPYG